MYYSKQVINDVIVSVESKTINVLSSGFVEATKTEYDDFIASLPVSEPQPPISSYISVIDAIDTTKARPVRIKRIWEGGDYFYDCLVTESIKDQYITGDISVGDYVLVHFDDMGEQVVTSKIFKSW